MILGDSLNVMASLAEREALRGKVQMIYVDPPYGIRFNSNWQVSARKRDVTDGKMTDASREVEQIKAFRDTWELGIHSYLTYLRDRLLAAKDLLTESGSVFVQIGDENVHLVRSLMDEVFGSENFVTTVTLSKTTSATNPFLGGTVDFIHWYAKDVGLLKYRPLYVEKSAGGAGSAMYRFVEEADGTRRTATKAEQSGGLAPGGRLYRRSDMSSQASGRAKGEGAASWFPVGIGGREYRPSAVSLQDPPRRKPRPPATSGVLPSTTGATSGGGAMWRSTTRPRLRSSSTRPSTTSTPTDPSSGYRPDREES
jgi:adenine-specific DNA-methyltransferase